MNLALAISLCTLPSPQDRSSCLDEMHSCMAAAESAAEEKHAREAKTFTADQDGCVRFSRQPKSKSGVSIVSSEKDCDHEPGDRVFIADAMDSCCGSSITFAEDDTPQLFSCWRSWSKSHGYLSKEKK